MFDDDIYGEDLLNSDADVLNQGIDDADDADGGEQEQEGAAQKIEIKIRKKRNMIRPIERFMGDRGLQSVGDYYKGIKYKGKGHEAEDITAVMSRMQHWAHRAFPKMKFEDALDIIEGLTKKRIIQTHMTKYRMDMLQPVVSQSADGEAPEEAEMTGVAPMDDFDDLLGDQIEQMTRVQKAKAHSTALNNTSMMNQSDVSLGVSAIPTTPLAVKKPPAPTLTSEQMAKIAENRLKALERRKQKEAEAEAARKKEKDLAPMDESVSLEDD